MEKRKLQRILLDLEDLMEVNTYQDVMLSLEILHKKLVEIIDYLD